MAPLSPSTALPACRTTTSKQPGQAVPPAHLMCSAKRPTLSSSCCAAWAMVTWGQMASLCLRTWAHTPRCWAWSPSHCWAWAACNRLISAPYLPRASRVAWSFQRVITACRVHCDPYLTAIMVHSYCCIFNSIMVLFK